MDGALKHYDAFLSHSHDDAEWVEKLAEKLVDECGFEIWFDQWNIIPGTSWQEAMAQGLVESSTCVVCIGDKTTQGWFKQEIERALNMQTKDPNFRVIPVVLPNGNPEYIQAFLELKSWVDFREEANYKKSFYLLRQGIRNEPPGRYKPTETNQPVPDLMTYNRIIDGLHKLAIDEETRKEGFKIVMLQYLKDGGVIE